MNNERRPRMSPINWIQWLTLLIAVLAIANGMATIILWQRGQGQHRALLTALAITANVSHQNQRALCLSKADRRRSLVEALAFLRQHPNGTSDFSRSFVLMSIRQDRLVLANLRDVRCTRSELHH